LACSGCGAELIAGAKFCRKCGTRPTDAEAAHAEDASPVPETAETAVQLEAIPVPDITPEVTPPAVQPAGTTVTQEVEPEIAPLPIVPEPARTASTLEQGPSASTSPTATEPATRQPSKALTAAGIAATVTVIGGGLFWWYSGKQSSTPVDQVTQVQASQSTMPAEAALAARPSEPAQPIQPPPSRPAQPEPRTPASSPSLLAPAPEPEPPQIAAAAPALPVPTDAVKHAKSLVQPDPMEAKVDELLRKAKGHIVKGQFDKAIATAESILAIDAGNRAAKALISNAKSRQMEALRSNTSLE